MRDRCRPCTPGPVALLAAAILSLAASFAFGSEPSTTRTANPSPPASPPSAPSPAASSPVASALADPSRPLPARFTAADFATLDEARAARIAAAFPRLTAFLESRRAEIESAQRRAARTSMPASRSGAIAALEAWLSNRPPPEARAQAATYLTLAPEDLLRDAALLLAAREEQKLKEQVDQIRQETAADHARLEQLATDPKLPAAERQQLLAQLADLAKSEADMATTGQNVPPEALALAARHREAIDSWSTWSWAKPR